MIASPDAIPDASTSCLNVAASSRAFASAYGAGGPTVVYVGRLEAQKGPGMFLRMAALLDVRYLDPCAFTRCSITLAFTCLLANTYPVTKLTKPFHVGDAATA